MTKIHKSKSLLARKGKRVHYDSDSKQEDIKRVKEVQQSVLAASQSGGTTPGLLQESQSSCEAPGVQEQPPASEHSPGLQKQTLPPAQHQASAQTPGQKEGTLTSAQAKGLQEHGRATSQASVYRGVRELELEEHCRVKDERIQVLEEQV